MTPSLPATLATWQFEPLVAVPTIILALCYVAAARRCGRRRRAGRPPRPWPGVRVLAFLAGLTVVAVATQSVIGVYDEVSLADHMVQHLLLIMVAPPLLIAGRPVTLLLHTVRNPWHARVKRIVRSPAITALTWPAAGVVLYSAVVLGTHLTGLVLARGALHDAEHVAYLAAGYLYFLPITGSEPIRWRLPLVGRYLLLLAGMPADIITGAVLMHRGAIGRFAPADVRAAGVIMLAGGELIMTVLALMLGVALVTRPARRTAGTADLAAYNGYLAALEPPRADRSGTATAPGTGYAGRGGAV